MKNQIGLFRAEPEIWKVRVPQGEQLLGKVVSKNGHVAHPLKSARQPLNSNIRTYHIDRLEDNTLYCKELGRTIPSTPQGKIDMEQLAHEIASLKDFFQSL